MAASKSAPVLTATVPSAVIPAVTGSSFSPAPEILSPTFCMTSPAAPIFANAVLVLSASVCRFRSSCSVSMISRWRASYCSCVMSPFARAVFACSAAVLRVSSFSLVEVTASASSLCFWESSSVLDGSSFSSFSTSFSCVWVLLMFLLTLSSALESLVVSPLISTVMPLILFAMRHLHSAKSGQNRPEMQVYHT